MSGKCYVRILRCLHKNSVILYTCLQKISLGYKVQLDGQMPQFEAIWVPCVIPCLQRARHEERHQNCNRTHYNKKNCIYWMQRRLSGMLCRAQTRCTEKYTKSSITFKMSCFIQQLCAVQCILCLLEDCQRIDWQSIGSVPGQKCMNAKHFFSTVHELVKWKHQYTLKKSLGLNNPICVILVN